MSASRSRQLGDRVVPGKTTDAILRATPAPDFNVRVARICKAPLRITTMAILALAVALHPQGWAYTFSDPPAPEETKLEPRPEPPEYYEGTDGLTGEALKAELQKISRRNQKIVGYGPTRPLLKQIHEDPANPDHVITIYARKSVPKTNFVEGGPDVAWDREHVVPQTFGARGGEYARSDLHNLFPSLRFVNSARGHLYFDESEPKALQPEHAPLCSYDEDSWEPPPEVKGDLARIVFYMDTRYDGTDSPRDISLGEVPEIKRGVFAKLSTLLEWHRNDPVSAEERRRNDLIFSAQGNRNPFVDHPEFVEEIYTDGH